MPLSGAGMTYRKRLYKNYIEVYLIEWQRLFSSMAAQLTINCRKSIALNLILDDYVS